MAKDSPPSLVDAVQKASAKDLESIDATVGEMREKQAEIQRTIDGLLAIRKAIDIRLNGKPKREMKKKLKQPSSVATAIASRVADEGGDVEAEKQKWRQKIYDYLDRAKRPMKPAVIAAYLNIDGRSVLGLCRHEWFKNDPVEGISIAKN